MSRMGYRFVFLSLIFIGVTIEHGTSAQDATACTAQDMSPCQQIVTSTLANSSATNQQKCQKTEEALQCVAKLACASDVLIRLHVVLSEDQLKNMNITPCDVKSQLYPAVTDACKAAERDCVFPYVDALMQQNKRSDPNKYYAVCQDLTEFIDCQKKIKACNKTKTDLETIVAKEKKRMIIQCDVPSLLDSLNAQQCSNGVMQCLTIDDWVENENLCNKSREAMKCALDLNCTSDIILMLIRVQAKERLAIASVQCDIDSLFPVVQPGTNACKEGLHNCLVTYVTTLMQRSKESPQNATAICGDLSGYVKCQKRVSSCSLVEAELKIMVEQEKVRMRVPTCEVDAFNNAPRLASRFDIAVIMSFTLSVLVWMVSVKLASQ